MNRQLKRVNTVGLSALLLIVVAAGYPPQPNATPQVVTADTLSTVGHIVPAAIITNTPTDPIPVAVAPMATTTSSTTPPPFVIAQEQPAMPPSTTTTTVAPITPLDIPLSERCDQWAPLIAEWFGDQTTVAMKVMSAESTCRPDAEFWGNLGLFQVNKKYHADMAKKVWARDLPDLDPAALSLYDPEPNIVYAAYLQDRDGWHPWSVCINSSTAAFIRNHPDPEHRIPDFRGKVDCGLPPRP